MSNKLPDSESQGTKLPTANEVSIVIDQTVYDKVMYWVNKSPVEISGMGKIVSVNGQLRVTSAILLEQENTASSTDIDATAMGKAMHRLKDEPGHLNWWWHSHVNMEVFWSGTDVDTIMQLGEHGWVSATVFNKRKQTKSAFYQKGDDFFPSVYLPDIPTKLLAPSVDIPAEWDAEYVANVKEKKYETKWQLNNNKNAPLAWFSDWTDIELMKTYGEQTTGNAIEFLDSDEYCALVDRLGETWVKQHGYHESKITRPDADFNSGYSYYNNWGY